MVFVLKALHVLACLLSLADIATMHVANNDGRRLDFIFDSVAGDLASYGGCNVVGWGGDG
jgi:hypothetical protein